MKKTLTMLLAALLSLVVMPQVHALNYDQNITAIFGSGNPNGGWTTATEGNIELGLRAKNRTTGATPNVNGVYTFPTGTAPSSTRALWNFEFSIDVNSGQVAQNGGDLLPTPTLTDYAFMLSVDVDPSAATSFVTIAPLWVIPDNSYGNSSTPNGAGDEVGIAAGLAYSKAQNSENITFFPWLGNPLIDATYDFKLTAFDLVGDLITETRIQVVVGEGGQKNVPDAGSTATLLSCTLVGLGYVSRRMKRK